MSLQQLIASRKFYAAVRHVVGARLPGTTPDAEVIGKVSEITREAVKRTSLQDLQQILKYAGRWVDQPTKDLAEAHLLETTTVDLLPDEFDPSELI